MKLQLTALIAEQIRTFLVMMAAGIFVESLWQARILFLQRLRRTEPGSGRSGPFGKSFHPLTNLIARAVTEILFWASATFVISMFLYYCAWGKLSVHAGLGFFAGLLLWKKMCCAIIKTWVKTDEVQNLKITARSSTWRKPAPRDRKKDVPKKKKKKKRSSAPNSRTPEANGLYAGAGSGEE